MRAVGTRYSGSYAGLPRVDYWSIWNEPNQAGWLTPQWSPDPRNAKSQVDAAPSIYRNLVANAWQALADTGHGTGSDTILIGETAPQGQGSQEGPLAVDRRAEVHPPPVLRRQQPQRPQGRAGLAAQLPRRRRDVRRAEPGAVPGHRLRPSSVRAAVAAEPSLAIGRLGLDGRPARAEPRARPHLPALRPEDAEQARRAAVPHRVRLPDRAGPDHARLRSTSRRRGSTRPSTSPSRTPTCARSTSSCSSTTSPSTVSTPRRTRVSRGARSRAACSRWRASASRPTRPT